MATLVHLPDLLRSYTGGCREVVLDGAEAVATLRDALRALDRRYPGIAFRLVDEQGQVRPHIRIFVARTAVRDLDCGLAPDGEITIVGALSGG